MAQQGQVFPLKSTRGGSWAYRYRLGGRSSRRVQREQGLTEAPTLAEFVDLCLAQHDGEPETTDKLRWLLAKSVRMFGDRRISGLLRSPEIAAWRMTITPGLRFEATQALRQVLARAVDSGMPDVNPATLPTLQVGLNAKAPTCGVFAEPFATGCHRLRPLSSINAPSIRWDR